MKVKLSNVRISFPSLFKPKAVGDGEPTFSAAFVIVPGSDNAKTLAQAMTAVAKEKWTDKAAGILKELKAKGRVCYKESPATNAEGEVYDGFADMHVLNASNKVRPLIIDRDKTPLVEADGRPYGGCYVYATLDLWAMDNQYGKRVCATLTGVQFARDGDAFGGGSKATEDDFDDLAPDEGDDALA
jgi:hypothetical protein